jgi:hypothetical protein
MFAQALFQLDQSLDCLFSVDLSRPLSQILIFHHIPVHDGYTLV